MRSFLAALATMALLTVPAYSQGTRRHMPQDNSKPEAKKTRVNEKDYKSALERIPDANQKRDPWQGVREEPKRK